MSAVQRDEQEAYTPIVREKDGRLSTPGSLVPDLREELDRKAYEALEYLVMGAIHDKITEDQFSTGLDVLFMTVSGLTSNDFIEVVTKATDELKAARARMDAETKATERGENYGATW